MMQGVAAVCRRLHAEARCDGVVSLGGAEGAVLASAGMQVLPVGIPKLIVTPLASGRRQFGPFVGIRDVMVMHSVIDIVGLNSVSRAIFDQAAGAIVGAVQSMARATRTTTTKGKTVGMTMLGNTTPAVEAIKRQLETRGYEPIIFHSNGVGGAAMEEMIVEDRIGAVIDYTTDELTDHLVGGFHDAGPSCLIPRPLKPSAIDLRGAGRCGVCRCSVCGGHREDGVRQKLESLAAAPLWNQRRRLPNSKLPPATP